MTCIYAYFLAAMVAAPEGATITSTARPVPNTAHTYFVDADTGMSITVTGPTPVLLQLRARAQVKRGILDIMRDDRYLSRNTIRFRRVKGQVVGFDYVTLVAWKVPEGEHTYRIIASGAEMVATINATQQLLKPFAAKAEEDTKAVADSGHTGTAPSNTLLEQTPEPMPLPVDPPAGDGGEMSYDLSSAMAESGAAPEVTQSLNVSLSDTDVESRLNQADDALNIGGNIYPRFFYRHVEPFSPSAPTDTATQSNLLHVYLDARPADQIRGYVRLRLLNTQGLTRGAPDTNQFLLDQLWLKWDIGRTLFVTLGKQHVRWGVGYFWNPGDILNPQHRDPLTPFDQRTGLPLLKLHFPIESIGANLYTIVDLSTLNRIERVPVSVRGEFVAGPAELIGTARFEKGRRPTLVGSVDTGLWIFDFRSEITASKGPIQPRWTGPFLPEDGIVPRLENSSEGWRTQVMGGIEMHLKYVTRDAKVSEDEIVLGAEFFHNDDGYTDTARYAWLQSKGIFEPIYAGRNYGGVYLLVPKPGPWDETTFALSGIYNLDDRSWFARFDYRVTLFRYLALDFATIYHGGEIGSLRLGYELPPVPAAPGFENGRTQSIQSVDVNLGLQIAL